MAIEFEKPQKVKITNSRWNVIFQVIDKEGNLQTYIASADSGVAESGIYFGTQEEYKEDMERIW
jgi:hypothetical protein